MLEICFLEPGGGGGGGGETLHEVVNFRTRKQTASSRGTGPGGGAKPRKEEPRVVYILEELLLCTATRTPLVSLQHTKTDSTSRGAGVKVNGSTRIRSLNSKWW